MMGYVLLLVTSFCCPRASHQSTIGCKCRIRSSRWLGGSRLLLFGSILHRCSSTFHIGQAKKKKKKKK